MSDTVGPPTCVIEVVDPSSGATRTSTTDGVGRWTIPELGVGTYRVRVTLSGFAPAEATGVRLQDVFNVFDRVNLVESDPFAPGRAGRAQCPIALPPQREVQLTLDFEF